MLPPTLEIARELIKKASVTPEDEGCQIIIGTYLKKMGFEVTPLNVGKVKNLWARLGHSSPLFVFAGHTDVVPPGNLSNWKFSPFSPTVDENRLYGRGAVDMKGSLAAMLKATEGFLKKFPLGGSLGFLITSDEEGDAIDGTEKVVEHLKRQGVTIDYCLVGEPTCEKNLGDTIKVGRRGSLNGRLKILGKQGHIAYPHLAENPIQLVLPVLTDFFNTQWDDRIGKLPPTVFQVSNLNSGTGATNVIPGILEVAFNFRFSDATSEMELKEKFDKILKRHCINWEIQWQRASRPFYRGENLLTNTLANIIQKQLGISAQFSTSGGTSDGRFISDIANQLIEFGLCNETIHQVNENTLIEDLDQLTGVYEGLLEALLNCNDSPHRQRD